MSATLYTTEILRLAMAAALHPRLSDPDATVDARTPVCGSHMTLDVATDNVGRIAAVGMAVHACAIGQASAGLFAASAVGHDATTLAAARTALADWLADDLAPSPDWPGIEAMVAARGYPARHAAILLPFDAALLAIGDGRSATEPVRPEPVEGRSFFHARLEEKNSPSTGSGRTGSGLRASGYAG